MNEFLANIVFVFHCIVIIFVLLAPFTQIPAILILHITFSLCLIFHWKINSNTCSLTILEAKLRGLNRSDTFSHQFIAPLYDISETNWNSLVHIVTYTTMIISIYHLFNNKKVRQTIECISNLKFSDDVTLSERISKYYTCMIPLFNLNS